MAFCIAGGILLITYGIIKIIGYLSDDLYNLAFQYDLGCGLFLIVLGMIVLVRNIRIQDHLYQGMGCLILLDSLLTIQTCGDAKKFGLETWYRILGFSSNNFQRASMIAVLVRFMLAPICVLLYAYKSVLCQR